MPSFRPVVPVLLVIGFLASVPGCTPPENATALRSVPDAPGMLEPAPSLRLRALWPPDVLVAGATVDVVAQLIGPDDLPVPSQPSLAWSSSDSTVLAVRTVSPTDARLVALSAGRALVTVRSGAALEQRIVVTVLPSPDHLTRVADTDLAARNITVLQERLTGTDRIKLVPQVELASRSGRPVSILGLRLAVGGLPPFARCHSRRELSTAFRPLQQVLGDGDWELTFDTAVPPAWSGDSAMLELDLVDALGRVSRVQLPGSMAPMRYDAARPSPSISWSCDDHADTTGVTATASYAIAGLDSVTLASFVLEGGIDYRGPGDPCAPGCTWSTSDSTVLAVVGGSGARGRWRAVGAGTAVATLRVGGQPQARTRVTVVTPPAEITPLAASGIGVSDARILTQEQSGTVSRVPLVSVSSLRDPAAILIAETIFVPGVGSGGFCGAGLRLDDVPVMTNGLDPYGDVAFGISMAAEGYAQASAPPSIDMIILGTGGVSRVRVPAPTVPMTAGIPHLDRPLAYTCGFPK